MEFLDVLGKFCLYKLLFWEKVYILWIFDASLMKKNKQILSRKKSNSEISFLLARNIENEPLFSIQNQLFFHLTFCKAIKKNEIILLVRKVL